MIGPLILFPIAAVMGLLIAFRAFKGPCAEVGSIVAHGAFAASGLVWLIAIVARGATATLVHDALGLFALAALGGVTLVSFTLRKRPLPTGLIVIHGLVAITAYALFFLSTVVGISVG